MNLYSQPSQEPLVSIDLVSEMIDRIADATIDIDGVRWVQEDKRLVCRLDTGWVGFEDNGVLCLPIMKRRSVSSELFRDDIPNLTTKGWTTVDVHALASIEIFRDSLMSMGNGTKREFIGKPGDDEGPLHTRLRNSVIFPVSVAHDNVHVIRHALMELSYKLRTGPRP